MYNTSVGGTRIMHLSRGTSRRQVLYCTASRRQVLGYWGYIASRSFIDLLSLAWVLVWYLGRSG